MCACACMRVCVLGCQRVRACVRAYFSFSVACGFELSTKREKIIRKDYTCVRLSVEFSALPPPQRAETTRKDINFAHLIHGTHTQ